MTQPERYRWLNERQPESDMPPESNVTDNLVGYEGDPEDPTPVYESDLAARQDDDPEPRGSALVWPMQFGESAKVPFA